MGFVAPAVDGERVLVQPVGPGDGDDLADLGWARSLNPAMGGWSPRPPGPPSPATALLRRPHDGGAVGVLDAHELPGYSDTVSLSIYTDVSEARGGVALEGYARYVDALFAQGARIIHHEVLALNRPIIRILRGIGVPPSARYHDHAYAAGRWWDVLIFSYDEAHWRSVMERLPNNPVTGRAAAST